jgi:hypothetical protein
MKRPKLFYIPGMISLLVVPVLFYMYQPIEKKQTVLKFVLPTDDLSSSPYFLKYSRLTVMGKLRGKKINTVYYNEDHSLNAKKLEFIAQEALKLKFYNDSSQVIKVRLSAETTYGEFVQLVNAMYRDKQKRYTLLGDDFYIFGEDPPEPNTNIDLPCLLCNDVIYLEPEKTWQERFWEEVNKYKSLIINNALLLSAFVLLIAVPAILKRKREY